MTMVYHATKVDQERALVQQISLFCDVPRALAAFAFSVAAMSSASPISAPMLPLKPRETDRVWRTMSAHRQTHASRATY